MFLKNCWYAAGWSDDFPAEGLETRTLLNEPLVFYRKPDGSLVALEDRCCHRLAPLSKGKIEGEAIRCMYHGLKFDPNGQCIEIPGQDTIPPKTCVRSFPMREMHSIAWVWMGNPDLADEALIPPFVGINSPDWQMLPGRMQYAANYMLLNDNLLDLSHVSYVHRNSFGAGSDFAETRPNVEKLERGVRVQRWLVNQLPPKYINSIPAEQRSDVWISYEVLMPGIFMMYSTSYPTGTAQACNMSEPNEQLSPIHAEFTCQAVTPITADSTCYFFGFGNWSKGPYMAEFYRDLAYMAFNEDKDMIEAQQQVIQQSPHAVMKATSLDTAPSLFRWLTDKLIREETVAKNT